MTVREVIRQQSEVLASRGVETPGVETELLVAHVLQLSRTELSVSFERRLAPAELEQIGKLILRRAAREPFQHIVGSTSFCGFEIAVTRDVLIPRPETELLAERAWGHLATLGSTTATVLDFGTGSGCLAIAVAARSARVAVHALDVSEAALAVARENAGRHSLAGRIHFHQGDGLEALPDGLRFDLILANPPYIPTAEIASLQPEVRLHDPRLALDGGADGLDFYHRLAGGARARLQPAGRLMAEFGDDQAGSVAELFQKHGWEIEAVVKDYTQRERFLVARPRSG